MNVAAALPAAGVLGGPGALGMTLVCPGSGQLTVAFCVFQYHQLQDEYFTSAVVLALILAALFGLVYLLIIPQ